MKRAWVVIAAALALLAGPATAQQQQQQDPFQGRFGVFAIASPPAEAAQLAKMMGHALDGLQPQRPGVQDVYLITASLWSDPVFEREATQAEAILRPHLGAEGRSILLSAGGQGSRNYPAATPENISAAIGQVGSLIDPNEDLVVIFLTSHGSPNGAAAIEEHGRLGGSLRPANLAEMLRTAGIRNRVIIVSACFSGALIAPLMDDNTIVLTAAAPDRTSFGCQPSREWTYFGDAYFNHAVRGGSNLIPAFDQAKVLIAQWENEQHVTPSNPQRSIGSHAANMLRQAERNAH